MSANAPIVAPGSPTADQVSAVENVIFLALSAAFPPFAPLISGGGAAIEAMTPWIIAAVQGHQFTLTELKQMQQALNAFGPSFPNAPGYVNAAAGGTTPAPGTTTAGVAPTTATVTLKTGLTVTINAVDVQTLLSALGAMAGLKIA